MIQICAFSSNLYQKWINNGPTRSPYVLFWATPFFLNNAFQLQIINMTPSRNVLLIGPSGSDRMDLSQIGNETFEYQSAKVS